MKREPYTYMILRYRHDAVAGEQINVGVVLHAPQSGFLGAAIRKAYGRISKVFPTVDGITLRQDLSQIERAFQKLAKTAVGGDLVSQPNVSNYALQVVGKDDSSLVWSDIGSGLTADPERTLADLSARFVSQYDEVVPARRSDAEIWKPFRDLLVERKVADVFESKTISTPLDEVEFEHAWKNGKWHCIQALSFDLATADGIREKAAKWAGHMVGLHSAADAIEPYFVVGAPADPRLESAYGRAVELIGTAPLSPKVVTESEFATFADTLAAKVRAHRL
jgi:hypothetical protein